MQNISPGCLFGVQSQFTEQKNVPGLNASEVVVYYALKFFNDKHNYAMIHACIVYIRGYIEVQCRRNEFTLCNMLYLIYSSIIQVQQCMVGQLLN